MTLADALADFELILRANYSPATVRTYAYALGKFARSAASSSGRRWDGGVGGLTVDHFIKFAAALARANYSTRTRTVCNSAAKAFMDWLIVNGHTEVSVQDDRRYRMAIRQYTGKTPPKPRTVPPRGVMAEVVRAALQWAHLYPTSERMAMEAVVVEFLFTTGCRASELTTLRAADLDLGNGTAVILGKGAKTRTVLFPQRTVALLEAYWQVREPNGVYAFSRPKTGGPVTTKHVRAAVAGACSAYAIRYPNESPVHVTPHSFRHSFATHMLERTGNLALVQDLLGHSSPTTTRIYAQVLPKTAKEAYEKAMG